MKLDMEGIRQLMASLLAALTIAIAAELWLIDLVSQQRVFGALLATELIVFAMLVYLFYKPTFSRVSKGWLLSGAAAAALFLFLALYVGGL